MKRLRAVAWAYLDEDGSIDTGQIYPLLPKKDMSNDSPFIKVEIRPITPKPTRRKRK